MSGPPTSLASLKDAEEVRDRVMAQADSPYRRYAGDNEWFAVWLVVVDYHVRRRTGVSLFDLPDVTLRDWYDDGITPKEAAGLALESGI